MIREPHVGDPALLSCLYESYIGTRPGEHCDSRDRHRAAEIERHRITVPRPNLLWLAV